MEIKAVGSMSLERFIKEVLIGEIVEIKEKHPYLAFSLICEGIEFLGNAISDTPWNFTGNSEKRFIKALKEFKTLNKYNKAYYKGSEVKNKSGKRQKKFNECNYLYRGIRCGFCHGLRPTSKDKGDILYKIFLGENGDSFIKPFSDERKKCEIYINVNTFYNDFKEACECLLKDRKSLNKHKELNNEFLTIMPVLSTNNESVAVSGVKITANEQDSNDINLPKPIKLNPDK
jgi:hypothetical protein